MHQAWSARSVSRWRSQESQVSTRRATRGTFAWIPKHVYGQRSTVYASGIWTSYELHPYVRTST